jgi:diguanylate cyclase (GGDEF)-like protein
MTEPANTASSSTQHTNATLAAELMSVQERERVAAREAQQLRELQNIQLRQVQQQLPRFLVITALSVLAATWLFWDWPYASNTKILIWAASFLVFLGCRGILVWWYGRRVSQNLNTLGVIITATAVITASFWVFAIIDFNPRIFPSSDYLSDVANRQVLLAALLAAQGIAALTAYAGYLRAFIAFTFITFTPSLLHLIMHPSSTNLTVATIGAIWWGFLILSARYLNRMVLGSLRLRIDNEKLIQHLRDTQYDTLTSNQQLAIEVKTRTLAEQQLHQLNNQLEARVLQRTEALKESQEGLTLAIEASGIALWDWSIPDGTLKHTNLEPLLGCTDGGCDDLLTQVQERVHPEDLRLVKRNIVRHLRRRSPRYEAKYRLKHQRGHWVWVEDKGRVVLWDAQGKPLRMLGIRRDITREREAEETQKKLDYLANHDRLTQLANRRQLRNRLHAAMTRARENDQRLALIYLNLDRFRQVNESLGFEVGDAILRETGRRLLEMGTRLDTLARLGGDEFALIFTELKSNDELDRLCEDIIAQLRLPFRVADHELLLGASLGISLFPEHGRELAILVNHADLAMQQAKRLGGNQWRTYSPDLRSATIEQLNLENSLRKAIFRDEFLVHYQPKVSLQNKRIVGMEALVRWQHPTLGLLYPGDFIPLAEDTGLISVITERVLQQACEQVKAWSRAGLGELTVAVNIPPQQLHKGDLMLTLNNALAESGLPAEQLEIELTETSLMDDPDMAASILAKVRERGIAIALDDFGTGYSSLSQLRKFPLNTLKVDQSFIREVGQSTEDGAIVRAIITMAHELGMTVVAEGVETPCHLDFLIRERCDYVQGYYISRPVSAEAMEALLVTQQERQRAI